jgi:hypothetical protein
MSISISNPVIFNWPSGAGGDFVLSILQLANHEFHSSQLPEFPRIESNFNKWEPYPQSNFQRLFALQGSHDYLDIEIASGLSADSNTIVHIHDLKNFLNLGTMIPDHVKIINLDSEFQNTYLQLLYTIKSPYDDENTFTIYSPEPSENIKNHLLNHKNFYNISYQKLYLEQDKNELRRLLDAFEFKHDDKILNVIHNIFMDYHESNRRLIESIGDYLSLTNPNNRLSLESRNKNFKDVISLDDAKKSLNQVRQIIPS